MSFFEKLKNGLFKTKNAIVDKIDGIFKKFHRVDEDLFDELEELLISADIGVTITEQILDELRDTVKENRLKEPEDVKAELLSILRRMIGEHEPLNLSTTPSVILVIGVNRAGVSIVKQAAGADPASVVFDAIGAVKSRGADVLVIDTAGRLHNKKNLMDELAKINRVINRELPQAAKETLLVLDATTGQNAVMQAKEFKEAADITGLILTKLDGTAKGGIIISIKEVLGIPVKFIGVGEGIDDMKPFDAKEFAEALFEV